MRKNTIKKVSDVMETKVIMIEGKSTVTDALKKMHEYKTSVLIVDRRHEDDEYGYVVIGDIARELLAKDRSPDRVNVYEIMSKPALSVSPTMDIRYCTRFMQQFGVHAAPVVKKDEVIGTVSIKNMVKGWAETWS